MSKPEEQRDTFSREVILCRNDLSSLPSSLRAGPILKESAFLSSIRILFFLIVRMVSSVAFSSESSVSTRMASQGSAEGVSGAIDLSETFKVWGLELLDSVGL